jgi:hypothetical protein
MTMRTRSVLWRLMPNTSAARLVVHSQGEVHDEFVEPAIRQPAVSD